MCGRSACKVGRALQYISGALGKHLPPEDHVTYESFVLLLPKETSHVALGKLELTNGAQDKYMKTSVPEPLKLIALFRRYA
jgi:hypothetical protein